MTDANAPAVRPAELAAYLAARMCHDFISPASAISSGLDLLDDPSAQDMREEAMGLITSSAKKLADLLSFCRVAFGASASAETFDARDLEKLAQGVFAHMRAELAWAVDTPAVNKPAARTLLNLSQMAGAALPTGGVAKVRAVQEGASLAIAIESTGPRARLRPEVLAGLQGQPPGEGLHGHWVQAYYTHLFVTDAGGRVFADVQEERVIFAATLPA
ncbi:MAG: histidine phosphotransferase [Phenylobacterium sp.]|jgi:histidine phosphotransferase ChpT|uniref:histidine phosphotransferase ChpT n=1 Tax=unclassified Phenylobacterium TaxID=2640670 RepID=UPI0008BAEC74|nr:MULTISPECIES: histidine phosphotransferase family protein [unclassified Phenylobacterium]MBJ7411939.1 histidine phosphotransferase [Phenylobacterium sp.]OHB31026.1 MAG: histidine phosphotransferase [Phenylobacterium sp. RIFCSPHIGHO2_01_FULL_69_31]